MVLVFFVVLADLAITAAVVLAKKCIIQAIGVTSIWTGISFFAPPSALAYFVGHHVAKDSHRFIQPALLRSQEHRRQVTGKCH